MKFSRSFNSYFDKWVKKTSGLWAEKRYVRSALTFLFPPLMIGVLICLIIKIITDVSMFLHLHYPKLIAMALVLWAFAGWLDSHKEKKQKWEKEEQKRRAKEELKAHLDYAVTKEATYREQGKIIFDVARELGALGIVPPMRLTNIYSPSRTIPKLDGAFSLAQFLLQKDCTEVDTELLLQMLQMKIDQRLTVGEYPSIEATHIYKGRVYSGLVVDSVRDSEGFVEVYTTLVNDAYCRYRQEFELELDAPSPYVDRRDMDY